MTRWELLEEWLLKHHMEDDHVSFTSREYSDSEGIDGPEASRRIQAYLVAQRASDARTACVLKREPGSRTSAARWSVGQRTRDTSRLGRGFSNDVRNRFSQAIRPDLLRIAAINPRAARKVNRQIESMLDGAMKVLEAAAEGIGED